MARWPLAAVCNNTSVHGSIPHHERKISYLQTIMPVRPEVSKGSGFCKRLNISGIFSCNSIALSRSNPIRTGVFGREEGTKKFSGIY
jgi:hypothetical protein